MNNLFKQFKSFNIIALAAIFVFSVVLTSCGDNKKESAESTEENTEIKTDTAASEHPSDTESHEEHPANEEGEGEHPTKEEGGEEHPAN